MRTDSQRFTKIHKDSQRLTKRFAKICEISVVLQSSVSSDRIFECEDFFCKYLVQFLQDTVHDSLSINENIVLKPLKN